MTIYYLYIKTHTITGLKYLGQTKALDPHKYVGSGVSWVAHLKEYGNSYTTTILRECQSKEERNEWGRYYSTLWDIAKSTEWANRIPETGGGAGGPRSAESIAKMHKTRMDRYGTLKTITDKSIARSVETRRINGSYAHTQKSIDKMLETKKTNGTLHLPKTAESVARGVATGKKNGSYAKSAETVDKIMATKKKNGTLNTTTPASIANMIKTKTKNGTLSIPRTADAIARAVATRKKDGSYAKSAETIAKMLETRKRNKLEKSQKK